MRTTILGIPIDIITAEEAALRINLALAGVATRCRIVTPNPEMLVDTQNNQAFAIALSTADLVLPDGTGVVLALRAKGFREARRITGTDFLRTILKEAAQQEKKVYFLGGKHTIAKQAAQQLQKEIPGWKLVGAESGGDRTPHPDPQRIKNIANTEADVLLVAWGHPYQDLWLSAAMPQLPTVKVAIGIGGAFDFYAGEIRRAPMLFRKLGLEWVWRVCREPARWRRIIKAVVVFPWLVITRNRLGSSDAS